jgi:hypothetical protein
MSRARSGIRAITAFALLSAAANFSTVKISGAAPYSHCETHPRTAKRNERARRDAAVQRECSHQLERQHDHSGGGVLVVRSRTETGARSARLAAAPLWRGKRSIPVMACRAATVDKSMRI